MAGILDGLGKRAKLMERIMDELTPAMRENTKAVKELNKNLRELLKELSKK